MRWMAIAAAVILVTDAQATGAPDPYAPLALYDGAWTLKPGKDVAVDVVNHCHRTGLFFACEQVVKGKSSGLLVFLPQPAVAGGLTYRTQYLSAGADAPGPWSTLTITGDDWVYAEPHSPSDTRYGRTLNHFTGRDRIHYAVQSSTDGKTWTTKSEGEETRVAAN